MLYRNLHLSSTNGSGTSIQFRVNCMFLSVFLIQISCIKNNYSTIQSFTPTWIFPVILKIRKKERKTKKTFTCYSMWVVETSKAFGVIMLASERDNKPIEFISLQPDPQFKILTLRIYGIWRLCLFKTK